MLIVPLLLLAQSHDLQVDPLLLAEAEQIWAVIGRKDNPVWPGWDARKTPLLFYLPGKQDALVNHPNPPDGFQRYQGGFKTSLGPIWIKDGPTIFDLDGQNTSTDVNGVRTLVVADTLSTRRQWIESFAGQPDASKQIDGGLYPDPYSSMTLIAHEAFHVYQDKQAPDKGGSEMALTKYPSLSVDNNVGYALEADLLSAALHAKSPIEAREQGVKWLAVRQSRRKGLSPECAAYEDATEFSEGLAKFIEYRLLECLQGKTPTQSMWLQQGFKGFSDLAPMREGLLRQMAGFMSGANVVNNDPYGASPVRFRLYYSGLGVAALLDRLGPSWKEQIFQPKATLTGLAVQALNASPTELEAALDAVKRSERYSSLLAQKQGLAQEGERHIQTVLAGLSNAEGEVIIDYSKLSQPKVGFAFTPFGILRVDDERTVFRLISIRGVIGALQFSEDGARPVLHDTKQKQVHLVLSGPPKEADIQEQLKKQGDSPTLALPGVSLKSLKGSVRVEGSKVYVSLAD